MARTPEVLARKEPHMSALRDFIAVYRLYRRHHSIAYAARIAYGCAFRGLPF
jgi:hypothetical protein